MLKDGFEDMRRHSSDAKINSQTTTKLNFANTNARFHIKGTVYNHRRPGVHSSQVHPSGWTAATWGDIQVGDVVLINNDEPIPADVLILNSSEPDGLCYVETKNLDGETNLKIRNGLLESALIERDRADVMRGYMFRIESENPNPNLYSFTGTAVFQARNRFADAGEVREEDPYSTNRKRETLNEVKVSLNINSILLRGCVLRNTEWVIGLVLYTGKDTKICMNAGATPFKQSKIEKLMNPQMTSLIAFQNIVPISIYLTIEVVKTIQSAFIYDDVEMFYEPLNKGCIPKSWNLSDDLGQIDYVFSDKTGTLTRNIMQFKNCSINGVVYGKKLIKTSFSESSCLDCGNQSANNNLSLTNIAKRNGALKKTRFFNTDSSNSPALDISVQSAAPKKSRVRFLSIKNSISIKQNNNIIAKSASNLMPQKESHGLDGSDEQITFADPTLSRELLDTTNPQYAPLRDFFTALAVCHSVLISKDTKSPGCIKYNSQSPDEAALVQAAKDVGFVFKARKTTSVVVDVLGEDEECELLNAIEFNSTRKRMSVIVKRPAGEIVLYCKGADSVIYERLAPGQDQMKEITHSHLEQFAEDGLRTLCIAYTVLQPEAYEEWFHEYNLASTALDDRETKMEMIAEKIEQNFILMGATAIEDKLQDGVPECIQTLLAARIKVWVLTGDKMETAINIGLSCNLLTRNMNLILIRGSIENSIHEAASTKAELILALDQFFGIKESEVGFCKDKGNDIHDSKSEMYALVIDGIALKYALEDDQKRLFLALGTKCAAVICCRVSPLQKAKVVELVKNSIDCLCLAIGDGANDVSMIQAAHIGVGIAGEEGLQAVMASDYAICQFKYLTKLLLVHGRWSYLRTAEMILNSFFKNIVWVMVLFFFQIYCGFSSQMVYDLTYMLFYNLVLTSTPVGFIGIFDKDIEQNWAILFPPLYKSKYPLFSYNRFALFMMDALYQSAAFFLLTINICNGDSIDSSGRTWDLGDLGVLLAIMGTIIANTFVMVSFSSWHWVSGLLMALVMIVLVLFSIIYAVAPSSLTVGLLAVMYTRATFWLCIPIELAVCLLPRIVLLYSFRQFCPTDVQIIQERAKTQDGVVSSDLRRMSRALVDRNPRRSVARRSLAHQQTSSEDFYRATSVCIVPEKAGKVEDSRFYKLESLDSDINQSLPALKEEFAGRPKPHPIDTTRKVQSEFSMPHAESATTIKTTATSIQHILSPQPRTPVMDSMSFINDEDRGGMNIMRTGEIMRNRGYSFSQSTGARNIIMGRARADIRSPLSMFGSEFLEQIANASPQHGDIPGEIGLQRRATAPSLSTEQHEDSSR
ncbi:hypothetical protein HDU83_004325 [Entophlyctis luteolus]|nr:hypothetical protein HDU83_004325 [Entophlyctis luteolus]